MSAPDSVCGATTVNRTARRMDGRRGGRAIDARLGGVAGARVSEFRTASVA
jgi:hypothetical protein